MVGVVRGAKSGRICIVAPFFVFTVLGCTSSGTSRDSANEFVREQCLAAPQTYFYECSCGYSFVARIEGDTAWLFLPGQTVSLPHVPSRSGAKYSHGAMTFWRAEVGASLETGLETHRNCKNNRAKAIWEDAKLRGVDFRAVGNEPGWHLEITQSDKIVFVCDYGQTRHEFAAPEPRVDRQTRVTTYEAANDEKNFVVVIEGRTWHDTMSGEAFETTVSVTFEGRQYRGGGRALH